MAEVDYEIKRDSRGRGRRLVPHPREQPRSRCGGSTSSATRPSPTTSCAASSRRSEGNLLSLLTSAGTYREDVFQRDLLLHPGPLLGPRLRQRQGRRARSSSCRPTSSRCTSRSPSTRARSTGSARSTSRATCSMPQGVLPRAASRSSPARSSTARSSSGRSAEADRLLQGPGLRLRQRLPRDAGQREDAHRRRHLRDPEGQAGHLRAHQHPRQHQDARQGDPPRAAHLRGRALQPVAARLLEEARQRARLLREGRVSTKRGASRRQDGRQRRGHRAPDRHVPDRRRFLVGRELHRPGADLAEQPASAAASRSRCRRSCRACASCSCCSSTTPTSSTRTGRSGSTSSTRTSSSTRSSATPTGGSLTWGYLLAEDLRLLLTYKLEDVGIGTSSFGFGGVLSARRRIGVPIAASGDRQPVPLGHHLVAPRLAVLRLAQQPHVPQPRLVQHALRRDRRPGRHLLAEQVHPLRGRRPATSIRSGGRSCFRAQGWKADLIASRDPLGVPIFERYFVGGIYNIRGFSPLSLGPVIRVALLAGARTRSLNTLPGRRQHAGDRQRRDRVPDLREGRHPRRRLLRHRQRLQPGRPVLQAAPAQRRRQQGPLQGPARHRAPTAPAGASASAGSRPSARCGSSGASRSGRCPASSPSSSSSRSATSSSPDPC